jgi:hypothetical protein
MSAFFIELPSGAANTLARVANQQGVDLLLMPGDALAGMDATLAELSEEIERPCCWSDRG